MKTTLVIMAAGIGSRFGGGIKQLESVGPNGELIIDYSIHDAITAGFNKIIFVIRKDIEAAFRSIIGDRIESVCSSFGVETDYAFQELDDIPDGFQLPEDRSKPWGTGHAVLSCRKLINEPFAVINADDYYGREAYLSLREFLSGYSSRDCSQLGMVGYELKNTLSEHGSVKRGICEINDAGFLTGISETSGVRRTPSGIVANDKPLNETAIASMNMWAFPAEFISVLEQGFIEFMTDLGDAPLKKEYLLPVFIGELLRQEKISVKVLSTGERWFGITFKDDVPTVREAFLRMINEGVYKAELFSD